MQRSLIELYDDSLVLAHNMDLSSVAENMLPCLFPRKRVEELSEEELIALVKAVITGLVSQVC